MTVAGSELPLVRSTTVGSIRIHALEAGLQRLDGGAMFGVVPRPLWEKRIPPDERNRIPLALRCLLVEAPEALVLVDTGIGNKESGKFRDIYGIDNEGQTGPTRLEDAIRAAGFHPADVDVVLSTHLHFDHAGGNTMVTDDGAVVPAFPGARHVVQKGEFDFAHRDNERIRASYILRNVDPVAEAGLWDFVAGEAVVTPGVRVLPTPGHTPHHQSVLVESGGETACFLADVCPTVAHVPLPWIMGYD
ncbi:MAG TPA: MBL fold metallo-hydrolase, partial [Longimicrobiales bacterium]|nr:MBL fold metallo-hydrolase [Longimicrobiales bacterium]